MTQSPTTLHSCLARPILLAACLLFSACVYRIDIQQGNVLEEEQVEQVAVGMTRSQVQFLLGTPMVADPFHQGRWDYPFYLRRGRSKDVERSWVVVHFENDRVSRIERDATLEPAS
jgi:outer membrane protein assembly factor BamE